MSETDKERLLRHIAKSDLTAVEKRYLESLVRADAARDESTIDAQPVKRGKWVEYSRNALETYIECTNCCIASRPIHLQMVTKNGSGLPDYCPNCGARMEDKEDA